MAESEAIKKLLRKQEKDGKIIAAICASPALVFKSHNIAENKKITCYPSFQNELGSAYTFVDEEVVVDGNIITSQGPSTVFKFALKIVEKLAGAEKAESVAKGILLK
jgi:4-methyl-5(b-hydroxyethyl)-thiazole monophosphate biosynthesis